MQHYRQSAVSHSTAKLIRRWTESFILALIILYAVILTIQSSEPLYTPRPGDGYFHSWADWAILIIFTIFT